MDRTLHYEIPPEMVGHKLSEFLHSKGFSHQNLVELKKMENSVLICGRWEYMNYRLQAGDVLDVCIRETAVSEKIPPVELPFPIVYEDEDITVVDKPAGMPIHPSMKNYENTLGNAAAYYYAKQNKAFVYRCINRLDKDTTGLTILAKHMVSCSVLYEEQAGRDIKRQYVAIVEGADITDEGCVDMPLGRKPDSAVERMVDFEAGERAVTHFRVVARKSAAQLQEMFAAKNTSEIPPIPHKGIAMLSLTLETGRTHQIRVHMKTLGHPLIGDFLYNPDSKLMDRQALHACRLELMHPITEEALVFHAPLPADMQWFFPDISAAVLDKNIIRY